MKPKMRGAMRSKTMWFSLALVVLGAIFDNFSYLQSILDPKTYGISIVCIGAIVAILRFVTNSSLDEK